MESAKPQAKSIEEIENELKASLTSSRTQCITHTRQGLARTMNATSTLGDKLPKCEDPGATQRAMIDDFVKQANRTSGQRNTSTLTGRCKKLLKRSDELATILIQNSKARGRLNATDSAFQKAQENVLRKR